MKKVLFIVLLFGCFSSCQMAMAEETPMVLKAHRYVLDHFGKTYVGDMKRYNMEYTPTTDTYSLLTWSFTGERPTIAQLEAVTGWQLMTNAIDDIVLDDAGFWRVITPEEEAARSLPNAYTRVANSTRRIKKSTSEIDDIWRQSEEYKGITNRNAKVMVMISLLATAGEDENDLAANGFSISFAKSVFKVEDRMDLAPEFLFEAVDYMAAGGNVNSIQLESDAFPYDEDSTEE